LNEPVQEGSGDATRADKITGLSRQVAADLRLRPQEDLITELRSRLADAGIEVEDAELAAIASTIALRE
jgi:hypothetical protein